MVKFKTLAHVFHQVEARAKIFPKDKGIHFNLIQWQIGAVGGASLTHMRRHCQWTWKSLYTYTAYTHVLRVLVANISCSGNISSTPRTYFQYRALIVLKRGCLRAKNCHQYGRNSRSKVLILSFQYCTKGILKITFVLQKAQVDISCSFEKLASKWLIHCLIPLKRGEGGGLLEVEE